MRHAGSALASLLSCALLLGACSGGGGSGAGGGQSDGAQPTLPPTTSASVPPGEPKGAHASFRDCTNVVSPQLAGQPGGDRRLSFSCGTLEVPADYAHPDGPTLKLYLVRVRLAHQKNRIGSLVINPGGPGGSGLDAAVELSLQLPTDLLSRFDLVGFDPRGVGLSEPVQCIPDNEKDAITASAPDATTPAQYQSQVTLARTVVSGCAAKYGAALAEFNTVETVRDMDMIRRALGDDKFNYLGFSYGTLLGSVYAQLYPDRARVLALDGAVDPAQDEIASSESQAKGFETAFDQFASACRAQGSKCPLGKDPRAFVTSLIAKAQKAPIHSRKSGETRSATGGNVQLAVISALYDQSQWPTLSRALGDAGKGDSEGILALDDQYNQRDHTGHYTNILDANIAVNCNDSDEKISDATIRAKLAEWRRKYPLFGASQALSLLTCQAWTAARHPIPKVAGAGAPPILVVGTTHDPATPYGQAKALSTELATGHLLTWNGEGHTAYPKTRCVTTAVDDYLISKRLPKKGASCPAR